MSKKKPKNPSSEVERYFRSKMRGNYCEGCGKTFEDGDIIFTPEQVAENGETIKRYFCGSPATCDGMFESRKSKLKV